MGIAEGKLEYEIPCAPSFATGRSLDPIEFDTAIVDPVAAIAVDAGGLAAIGIQLTALAETDFEFERVASILTLPCSIEDWRVGEALAEGYLATHRACLFPWPDGRDERRANSSLPGADLVGLQLDNMGYRLAFGEVKTSAEAKNPPQVLHGRAGLISQLEYLCENESARAVLVKYLAFRAGQSVWESHFQTAAKRYLHDVSCFALFGVLVRDVPPHPDDLRNRALALAKSVKGAEHVELLSIYIPGAEIASLGKKALAAAEGASCQ